jgi:raffinose/stachyose/melibiose transport system substrate-binding protein
MKKFTVCLLIGAMAASMLTGWGGGSSDSSDSKADSSSETMTIMMNGSDSDAFMEGYRKIIDGFNESNEYGVKAEIQNITNSDYKTKLTTMMASDSETDIIFTWELGYLENFVNGDKIVSLQKYLDEDEDWKNSFNGGILEPLTYDGEVYAIPTQQCTAIMYYNKAIFDKYGLEVPTTYDEYVQVCDTLKENGVTPVALASTADDAWLVSQYIQQLSDGIKGEDIFNSIKDGTGKWNDEGMVEAGKLFQEEVNKGYFEDGFTGVSREEAQLQFANGQTAMYFNGCWEISNLDKKENVAEAENISCFLMPAVNEEYAGVEVGSVDASYAITKNCKNVDAAVALLKYMTNEESTSLLLYDYGRIPSTNIDIDDSKLTPLCVDFINLLGDVKAQTPWFDRVDTDLGNEFNNTAIGIANGDDVQEAFDALQSYAESKSK